MSLRVAAASGVLVLTVVTWQWLSTDWDEGRSVSQTHGDAGQARTAETVLEDSPFALASDPRGSIEPEVAANQPAKESDRSQEETVALVSETAAAIDVSQIGRSPINDADFDALVAHLRADPDLLRRLIDEFRQEQDAGRSQQLMKLLGYAGGAEVTLLAGELIYSGNAQSRQLGLQMLQRAQPGSADVQQIAGELLATEVAPEVLVDTLAMLARPGAVASEQRSLVADQVAVMASHPDAGVRGVSLDILSRLSTDGRDTGVLLAGLTDSDPRVRESAAYALVGHEERSTAVTNPLWQLARDTQESRSVRSAAIMALNSLALPDDQSRELKAIERELNTVKRGQ